MFRPADLPDILPVFPLPGAVLLPRAHLPLNIFEPRYLAMLEDVIKTPGRLIGMVQPVEAREVTGEPRLHSIGCAGRVIAFSETRDGRYQITLAGISRFRLERPEAGFAPYMRATIDWSGFEHDLDGPAQDRTFDREAFLATLGKFFQATGLKSDWESLQNADDEMLVNSLSMMFPFDVEDKQALLEAPTLSDRRETLVTLMEFAMASGGNDGKLQ